jgi:hypothetical protein
MVVSGKRWDFIVSTGVPSIVVAHVPLSFFECGADAQNVGVNQKGTILDSTNPKQKCNTNCLWNISRLLPFPSL